MFTGIVTDVGEAVSREARANGARLVVACGYDLSKTPLGASIACAGVCLTVTAKINLGGRAAFAVDVSSETLAKTTIGDWAPGRRINLEQPLRLGDELGGHIVSGHVDGVGEVVWIKSAEDSRRIRFRAPPALARFIAEKGSIAIDGVSLTVNTVEGAEFEVNLIPHTLAVTSLRELDAGSRVNLEIDLLARYVARLHETAQGY